MPVKVFSLAACKNHRGTLYLNHSKELYRQSEKSEDKDMKNLKQELIDYVERELKECEKYSRDAQDVLGYRSRAYGAVSFAFCLNALLYKEMCDWWNDEMLEQFNAVLKKYF